MKAKLLADRTTFQAKVRELLEEYVDGPAKERQDIARQVEIARKAMKRYGPAMRDLAR